VESFNLEESCVVGGLARLTLLDVSGIFPFTFSTLGVLGAPSLVGEVLLLLEQDNKIIIPKPAITFIMV
jgi:hypothetical protein